MTTTLYLRDLKLDLPILEINAVAHAQNDMTDGPIAAFTMDGINNFGAGWILECLAGYLADDLSTPHGKTVAKRAQEKIVRAADAYYADLPQPAYSQNCIHAAGRRIEARRQNELERKHGNPAQDGIDAARQDAQAAREAEELAGYIKDTKDDIEIALKIGDTDTAERLEKALAKADADTLQQGRAYTNDSGEPMQAAHALHRHLISAEEDDQRDDLLAAFEVALRDLTADAMREADRVGGYFRSPGIRQQLKKLIEEVAGAVK